MENAESPAVFGPTRPSRAAVASAFMFTLPPGPSGVPLYRLRFFGLFQLDDQHSELARPDDLAGMLRRFHVADRIRREVDLPAGTVT